MNSVHTLSTKRKIDAMADEFIAHPLITITNVIWSFSRTT
ncbi:MAG: ADP-ribose pyrophosphatase, partial [Lacticaseibacillus rhamnosus]